MRRPICARRPVRAALAAGLAAACLGLGPAIATAQTLDEALGLRPTSGAEPARPSAPVASAAGIPTSDAAPGASAGPPALRRAVAPAPAMSGEVYRPVRSPVRPGTRAPVRRETSRLAPPPPVPDGVERTLARQRARLAAARAAARERDPYEPLGIEVGGVVLRPSIEAGAGHDSNPNRVPRGRGSAFWRTEGAMSLRSDWARHALEGELRGGYSRFRDVPSADRPDGEGRVRLRLDATRDLRFDIEGRFRLETQSPGDPDSPAGITNRPLTLAGGVATGVTWQPSRLSIGLRGAVDRASYEDAKLADGTIADQSDRNYTQYELRGRAGYELSPGVRPFVEARIDSRVHDRAIDTSGFRRDSVGAAGVVGSSFEISRMLTGEIAAGYGARDYDDPRLTGLRGPLLEAALIWEASALTTARLIATTTLSETTRATSPGAVEHRIGLEVTHRLRRNLSVTGTAEVTRADYVRDPLTEDTLRLGARLEYRPIRSVALRASFTHERLTSSVAGRDYTANAWLLGLKLQR
jgi:hypothetical protein